MTDKKIDVPDSLSSFRTFGHHSNITELFLFLWTFNMVVDVMISQKIPPDKIFPRSYMDFEKKKYQKDPGMNRVKVKRQFFLTPPLSQPNVFPVIKWFCDLDAQVFSLRIMTLLFWQLASGPSPFSRHRLSPSLCNFDLLDTLKQGTLIYVIFAQA